MSRRIRIAQVAGVWSDCEWFAGLCRDLTARGYDIVAVIDERPGDLGARLEETGIRCHRLALNFATDLDRARLPIYAAKIPLAAIRLARILGREKIDIVHSHVFVSVIVARLAAALARVRHVAGISGPRHLEAQLTRIVDRRTSWMDDVSVAGCRSRATSTPPSARVMTAWSASTTVPTRSASTRLSPIPRGTPCARHRGRRASRCARGALLSPDARRADTAAYDGARAERDTKTSWPPRASWRSDSPSRDS